MRFILQFTYPNGTEDSLGVEGENIEEIREKSSQEMKARGIDWDSPQANFWSEEIK